MFSSCRHGFSPGALIVDSEFAMIKGQGGGERVFTINVQRITKRIS